MLEDYNFPTRKICKNSTKFITSCLCLFVKHNPNAKFCDQCGSELVIHDVDLYITLMPEGKNNPDDEIKITLEDLARLMKAKGYI